MPRSIVGYGGLEIRREGESQDITAFVESFVWIESMISGGWSWQLVFDTEDWKDWDDLLLGLDDPGRDFRLKAQEGDVESTTEWLRAFVDGSRVAPRGRTLSVKVWGGDIRLELQQNVRTRAWLATSVSDVIRRVAAENDLIADVATTLGSRDRWQIRSDDWTYISSLARQAATGSGRGDSYLWVDGGTLRFGAPEVESSSARRHDLSEVDNRADGVVVTNHGRAVDRRGGATLLGVSYDILNGVPIRFLLDGPAANTQPALGPNLARPTAGALRVLPFYNQDRVQVEEQVRGVWGLTAPRYFTLALESRTDLTLRLGTVLEILGNLNERQSAPVFGRYVVLEFQHTLVGGDIRTTAACFRREAFKGDEEPSGVSVSFAGSRDRSGFGLSERPRSILVAEVLS